MQRGLFFVRKLAAAGNLAGGGGNDVPAAMLDWGDREGDRFSFEDSDRFEEDSLCSWSSEPESVYNNWRGWKKPIVATNTFFGANKKSSEGKPKVFLIQYFELSQFLCLKKLTSTRHC